MIRSLSKTQRVMRGRTVLAEIPAKSKLVGGRKLTTWSMLADVITIVKRRGGADELLEMKVGRSRTVVVEQREKDENVQGRAGAELKGVR